ncbi:MAG: response regulator [Verrucomicrobiales bacterium]|nr:response regulator [Verrucomicrobiales bacterium]
MTTQPAVPVRGKILVIDDNPIIQRAVYFALRDHGYKVLMAGEIPDAFKIIRAEHPDLILVDLSFPMDTVNIAAPMQDGYSVMDWIRSTPGFEKTPVMIISGTDPAKYKERADAFGIKACLHKPLDKESLLAAVQQALGGNPAGGQPGQS